MAMRLIGLCAVLTLVLLAAPGCGGIGSRPPSRLADKSRPDSSGRAHLAAGAPARPPAHLAGNVALASHAPRHAEPEIVTTQNFEELVLNSPVPVLMDCWAPWCGPCQRMLPVMHDLAGEYEGRVVVAKLDIDAHPEVAARYGVTNIPAFLIFQDGELVDSVVGAVPKSHLERRLTGLATPVQTVSRDAP